MTLVTHADRRYVYSRGLASIIRRSTESRLASDDHRKRSQHPSSRRNTRSPLDDDIDANGRHTSIYPSLQIGISHRRSTIAFGRPLKSLTSRIRPTTGINTRPPAPHRRPSPYDRIPSKKKLRITRWLPTLVGRPCQDTNVPSALQQTLSRLLLRNRHRNRAVSSDALTDDVASSLRIDSPNRTLTKRF